MSSQDQLCYKEWINPIALRTAKTLWSFGHSECILLQSEWPKQVSVSFDLTLLYSGWQDKITNWIQACVTTAGSQI